MNEKTFSLFIGLIFFIIAIYNYRVIYCKKSKEKEPNEFLIDKIDEKSENMWRFREKIFLFTGIVGAVYFILHGFGIL